MELSLLNKSFLLDLATIRLINNHLDNIHVNILYDPEEYIIKHKNDIISFYMSRFINDYKEDIKKLYEKSLKQAEKDISDFYLNETVMKEMLMNTILHSEKSKIWIKTMEHVARTVDAETLEVTLNITNYKPCHNIRLLSKDKLFDVQLRSEDIVIYGGNCYGRKVALIKSHPVNDENFKSSLLKIKV